MKRTLDRSLATAAVLLIGMAPADAISSVSARIPAHPAFREETAVPTQQRGRA
jgi:hypothetical protein